MIFGIISVEEVAKRQEELASVHVSRTNWLLEKFAFDGRQQRRRLENSGCRRTNELLSFDT